MLGEDFGAEMTPLGDRPGFRFTVTEPPIRGTTPEGRPQVTIRIRQDSVFSDK